MPSFKKVASTVLSIVFALTPLVVYLERQNIYDWWRLRNYTASSEVERLAVQGDMSDQARKIFYVTHPQLQAKEAFRSSCTEIEKTIVLGCYKSGEGIYVYIVSDARLEGVMQVTAAHEMLHAAYERLSSNERKRIDALTEETFNKLSDERVIKNISLYKERDATIVPNELHSILGTEVRELPAELETYYRRYFKDRSKVVAYLEHYEAEFTTRKAAADAYQAQMSTLKISIDDMKASLETQGKAIDADEARLNALAKEGKAAEFNALLPVYRQKIANYNAVVRKLQADIDTYNGLYDKLKAVVVEEQELKNAIDSSVPSTK